jgi:hypothetical protein
LDQDTEVVELATEFADQEVPLERAVEFMECSSTITRWTSRTRRTLKKKTRKKRGTC